MQNSTKSSTEISKNMNTDNYNNRIMQIKMMLDDDMSITSLTIKHSKELFINEQKNRMRIICTIIKQE